MHTGRLHAACPRPRHTDPRRSNCNATRPWPPASTRPSTTTTHPGAAMTAQILAHFHDARHGRPRPRILLGLCWPYPLRFGVLLMIVVVGIDRGGASRRDALTAGRSERCSRSGESDGAEMLSSVARASSGGRHGWLAGG